MKKKSKNHRRAATGIAGVTQKDLELLGRIQADDIDLDETDEELLNAEVALWKSLPEEGTPSMKLLDTYVPFSTVFLPAEPDIKIRVTTPSPETGEEKEVRGLNAFSYKVLSHTQLAMAGRPDRATILASKVLQNLLFCSLSMKGIMRQDEKGRLHRCCLDPYLCGLPPEVAFPYAREALFTIAIALDDMMPLTFSVEFLESCGNICKGDVFTGSLLGDVERVGVDGEYPCLWKIKRTLPQQIWDAMRGDELMAFDDEVTITVSSPYFAALNKAAQKAYKGLSNKEGD